ncbi:hypothetical protein C8R46DRAFT_1224735 [Mycena filopes]|nr:hypothetical protein C8R46DRAFT_1290986 [Mycena filopes]KAJ7158822.1 hypothetical protein C8R46DRAFT_1224735 [Mycena filopes]
MSSPDETLDDLETDTQVPSTKRRPGRPKGSKNKPKTDSGTSNAPAPRRGRPPGTGHKQKAQAAREAAGESDPEHEPSRPVGRPPKNAPAGPVRVHVREPGEHIFVKGVPDPTRARHLAEAAKLVEEDNPGSTLNPSPSAELQVPNTLSSASPSTPPQPPTRDTRALHLAKAAELVSNNNLGPVLNLARSVPSSSPSAPSTTSQPPIRNIIPEANSSTTLTLPDDGDEYSDLINDGLGDDDGDDDGDSADEDGVIDTPDPSTQPLNSDGDPVAAKPRRTARPLPSWLQVQFDAKVAASKTRGTDNLPALYRDHQTFWFPETDPFFLMRELDPNLQPQRLYRARFFLWDPAALIDGIPCPNCGHRLHRHGHVPRPRRCVELDHTFYIIGYRYRCPTCVNPDSKLKTVTFRSWDSRVLQKLPASLSTRFPAVLTHRSALSEGVFMFMRSCFQNGMGAKQFADALRVRHLENYDKLQVSYLSTLATHASMARFTERKFKSFLPFEDTSADGFHGFVPSSQWLRDLFDKFVEQHAHELDQHTSQLSLDIGQIDHSFKFAKHIAKVNGEQIFIALLTVTNEKGEIRICNLVATKSHSQFELALDRMRESLERYGHDQPRLFYTDNIADKDFLERCFPSLHNDVVAVEKYPHLEALEIPPTLRTHIMDTAATVQAAMTNILQDLPDDTSAEKLVVFIDSEWNVETSAQGYITGRGQTAIFQIAYQNNIYILQIGKMLAGGRLPKALLQLLSSPRVLKVGRSVTADLKYLHEAVESTVPFVGGVDLAKLAKDRLLVSSAKVGLADLCATILERRLNKDVSERTSNAWDREQLTPQQVSYAALDVYACLCIYDAIIPLPIPSPLPKSPAIGVPVLIFNADQGRVIGRGKIAALEGTFDAITISATRCLVEVLEVLVPAAIITTHRRQALSIFGPAPFNIVCLRSHLRLGTSFARAVPASPLPPDPSQPDPNSNQPQDELESSDFGALLLEEMESATPRNPATLSRCTRDSKSAEEGARILAELKVWSDVIHSRVLKDPFHVFNQFYISVAHGLRVEFARALRDAMFIPDAADKARIVAWGLRQNPPQTWEFMVSQRSDWVWRRCKRIIPPPQQLHRDVSAVFHTFGPLKDATTGLPLFNSAAWTVAKNTLDLIHKGFLSDPPGIALYFQLGVDAKTVSLPGFAGLPLYRCMRGTNNTEGGVHTHLRSRLPTSGAGIRHSNACLKEFVLRHNLLVGTFNSTGERYKGHYSIWLTNELQELTYYVQDILINPQLITGWVNGNLYQQSNETTGVLPIPEDVRRKYGMAIFDASLDLKKERHRYLASLQCTRKAVLPIHNDDEKALFRKLMGGSFGDLGSSAGADKAVRLWNAYADMNAGISYKLPEQLKAYFNGNWKTNTNIKLTKSSTFEVRAPLLQQLKQPARLAMAPKVPETSMKIHSVLSGLLPLDSDVPPSPLATDAAALHRTEESSTGLASSSGIPASSLVFAAGSSTGAALSTAPTQLIPTQQMFLEQLSKKRVAQKLPEQPREKKRQRLAGIAGSLAATQAVLVVIPSIPTSFVLLLAGVLHSPAALSSAGQKTDARGSTLQAMQLRMQPAAARAGSGIAHVGWRRGGQVGSERKEEGEEIPI